MPDQDFGGGYGYQGQRDAPSDNRGNDNPRAGDTPGFGNGGGGAYGPGGGGGNNDIGQHESLNAAMGRQDAAAREVSYTGGGGNNGENNVPQVPSALFPAPAQQFAPNPVSLPYFAGQNLNSPTAYPTSYSPTSYSPTAYPTSYSPTPQTFGVPTIIGMNAPAPYVRQDTMGKPSIVAGGQITPTITNIPLNREGTFSGPKGGLPMSNEARFTGYTAKGSTGSDFTDLDNEMGNPVGTTGKLMGVESTYGTNPKAFNLTNGPSGIFQMSREVGEKYGIVGPGYDLRNDPIAAARAAASYASDIRKDIARSIGRAPTAGEIGLGYNQGSAGAKALLSNPNISAAEALAPAYKGDIDKAARAIRNNGGDPNAPANQFTNKITQAYENTPATSPTLVASLQNLATGVGSAVNNLAAAATSAPKNFANALQSILEGDKTSAPSTMEAGSYAPKDQYALLARGTMNDATKEVAYTAPETTTGSVDWSKGNLPFIDNTKAKETLYNQPNPNFPSDSNIANSVTGDTPESYAQKFTDGDVSKVQSRISSMNGFPQVEFFAKGLDEKFGEGVRDLVTGIGSIFKPQSSDNGFRSSPSPSFTSSYGGGGNKGETVRQSSYPAPAAASQTVAALETPQNPVYTTGIDLLRKKYIPRGSVATRSNAYT
jgi:hypothetical protein